MLAAHGGAHPGASPRDRAETYFRLAIISLRTNEPEPAVPEMEMLFVACIEADPRGPRAAEAYALLEEYGYIHEEHLARQIESRVLIDMPGLRAMAGIDDPATSAGAAAN